MMNEEIQKRIESAKQKHENNMAMIFEKKKENKKLSEKLAKDKIILAYLDIDYCRSIPFPSNSSRRTVYLSTKVSVAAKQNELGLKIVYTILSEHDHFDKAKARKILATRLEDPNAKQCIYLTRITNKAIDNSEKIYSIINKAIQLELVSNTDTVPAWLYNGIRLYEA
jgi:hypothetical protein